ncbi:hypothetical protein [Microbulbifer pacificus]|uniref:hypothetical protein n=1 Tax=Microbulbifer pacificus TaxID=407164 RepID=UPI000CF4C095|nr:hypothetical protein [Microbulbifer pacificus]
MDIPLTTIAHWYNHGRYLLVFVFGYLFAQQPRWWRFVIARRAVFLSLAIGCYALIVADRNGAFDGLDAGVAGHPGHALAGRQCGGT